MARVYSSGMSSTPEEPSADQPPQEELSLRTLSEAFAEALARRRSENGPPEASARPDDEPSAEPAEGARPATETPAIPADKAVEPFPSEPPRPADKDDSCPINPRTIFEAMLFVGDPDNRPLECDQAASLMRGVEPADVPGLVDELNESYRQGGCPYRIMSDGAGFRLALTDEFHRLRDRFYGRAREARLSQAAIDVLAIVAYRQPIASDEVNRLRDKPSHHLLAQLVRRRLLRVERSCEKPRKPLYCTTDRFLELFELDSLADLPESEALVRS